jgi:hypothetical protein
MDKDQTKNEKEDDRKLVLNFLQELLEKIPPERRSNPEIGFGPKTFTPDELVREIEAGTEEGNLIIKTISKNYLALKPALKRSE